MDDHPPAHAADDAAVDSLLDALRHERRRRVLSVLATSDGGVSVETVAREVASMADGSRDVSDEAVSEVHVSLRHSHLPKLADSGLVTFDRERGSVAPDAALDRVRPFLDSLDANEPLERHELR